MITLDTFDAMNFKKHFEKSHSTLICLLYVLHLHHKRILWLLLFLLDQQISTIKTMLCVY